MEIKEENMTVDKSAPISDSDVVVDAKEKLNAGKRNLACDEYPQAVDALAAACQLLASKFGEEGDELAEAYYYYGKALLELARMENGVLGEALDGVPAEEENEADLSETEQFEKASLVKENEREEVRDQVYSAMSADEKETPMDETAATSESCTESSTSAGDKSKVESCGEAADNKDKETQGEPNAGNEDQSEEKNEEGKADDQDETEQPDEEGEEVEEEESVDEEAGSSQDEGDEDADDIPNLQLSWEVLELAKKIYSRQVEKETDKNVKVKLSDVYRTLGEVSLETGSAEQAVQDIQSCLAIQAECLEADDRYIAETHYQLGNAHLLDKSYSDAVDQLRKAKFVIEMRITNLDGKLKDVGDDKQAEEKLQKELTDLRQLLPDIIAKVEDVEDELKNAERAETEIKATISSQSSGTTTIGFGSTDTASAEPIAVKKANDISNLVRKRKPDEIKDEDVKKTKTEDGAGDKENGQTSPAADVVNSH